MPEFDPDSPDEITKARAQCMKRNQNVKRAVNLFNSCEKRVTSKSYTAETCHQEAMDLAEALDNCVGDRAFLKLK